MDTDGLRDMAARLRTVAGEVDVTADRQVTAAHAAHWVSTSGDVFRASSLDLRDALLDGSAHLTDTAARIDALADTVDARVAAIAAAAAAAAREAEEFAEGVAEGLESAAHGAADVADDLADGIARATNAIGDGLSHAGQHVVTSIRDLP